MESIHRALSRVEQLKDRLGVEQRSSEFRQILDANLGSGGETPSATVAPPRFQTFGAVFGGAGVIPVSSTGWGPTSPSEIVSAAELHRYLQTGGVRERNGRLGDHYLVAVAGGWSGDAKLLPPAATAWTAMRDAAASDGIDLRAVDSYRSWDVQARAHDAYLEGRKQAYVRPPGTSEHGVGLAVDVTNGSIVGPGDPEWDWLNDNARRFGWYPISNESWHWEFRGLGA